LTHLAYLLCRRQIDFPSKILSIFFAIVRGFSQLELMVAVKRKDVYLVIIKTSWQMPECNVTVPLYACTVILTFHIFATMFILANFLQRLPNCITNQLEDFFQLLSTGLKEKPTIPNIVAQIDNVNVFPPPPVQVLIFTEASS
jgi:hypothetical protein